MSKSSIKVLGFSYIFPIPNPKNKRVDFELFRGKKGKGTTIQTADGEYDLDTTTTINRSVGKCPNCSNVIEQDYLMNYRQMIGFKYQLYAIAYKKGKGSLEFKTPTHLDLEGASKAATYFQSRIQHFQDTVVLPDTNLKKISHR